MSNAAIPPIPEWVTVASLVLTCLVLGVSHLSSQEAGRLSRDLATPADSVKYLASSLVWLLVSTVISKSSHWVFAVDPVCCCYTYL